MGVRTRSATSSPVKKGLAPTTTTYLEEPEQKEPVKLFVVPEQLSKDARILSLPHPRERSTKRFLFCPLKGLFEYTKISAPSIDPRSILFSPSESSEESQQAINSIETSTNRVSNGYISKDAQLFVATPFDPAFLLLPLLPSSIGSQTKTFFQPLEDLLEPHLEKYKHLQYLLWHGRGIIDPSLSSFCDEIDAGDEKMVRVNEDKVIGSLLQKAERVVANGLPASLEEKFVTRVLEAPVLSIKREDTATSIVVLEDDAEITSDNLDSQTSKASSTAPTIFSESSTVSSISTVVAPDPSSSTTTSPSTTPEIYHLQRLKIALTFIVSSYLSPVHQNALLPRLTDSTSHIDFTPLETHLSYLSTLRSEALNSRSLSDFTRKRNLDSLEDQENESRAEKKRKQDEEEKKRKANQSRGVRDLKKVDTTGMKKMSDFFTKKAAGAAKAKS